jgi:hypothetical protein
MYVGILEQHLKTQLLVTDPCSGKSEEELVDEVDSLKTSLEFETQLDQFDTEPRATMEHTVLEATTAPPAKRVKLSTDFLENVVWEAANQSILAKTITEYQK